MIESIDTESDRCKHCHGICSKKNLEDHEQTCEKLNNFVAAKDECFQCMLCSETFLNRATTCEHILSNTEHMYSIIENNSDATKEDKEEEEEVANVEDEFESSMLENRILRQRPRQRVIYQHQPQQQGRQREVQVQQEEVQQQEVGHQVGDGEGQRQGRGRKGRKRKQKSVNMYVCSICQQDFKSIAEFIEHSMTAHVTNNETSNEIENNEIHSDIPRGLQDEQSQEESHHKNLKSMKTCQHCKDSSYSSKYLKIHEKSCNKYHHFIAKIETSKYQCQLCAKICSSRTKSYKHVSIEHANIIDKQEVDQLTGSQEKADDPPFSEENIKSLECPVCYQIPSLNQIYQCENGHNVCVDCYSKIPEEICPQCRKQMFKTKFTNFVSNNVLPRISINCPFDACSLKISWSEMENHKKNCKFGVLERKREKKLIRKRKREEEIERQQEENQDVNVEDDFEEGIQEFQRVHTNFLDVPPHIRIQSPVYYPRPGFLTPVDPMCNIQ